MTAALGMLLALHGDGRLELTYFWSAILIVLLPTIVFGTIAVLAVRGYLRRNRADEEPGPLGRRAGGPAG